MKATKRSDEKGRRAGTAKARKSHAALWNEAVAAKKQHGRAKNLANCVEVDPSKIKWLDGVPPEDLVLEVAPEPAMKFPQWTFRRNRERWSAGHAIKTRWTNAKTEKDGEPSWEVGHGPRPTRAAAMQYVRALLWNIPHATAWVTGWPAGKTTFYRLAEADRVRALAGIEAKMDPPARPLPTGIRSRRR